MSFEPLNGSHAIAEVVFGLMLRRPFNRSEIEALANSHDRWRDMLPRLSRQSTVQFLMGAGGQLPPPEMLPTGAGGVLFDRVKPDGELAWRLSAQEQSLNVNCLEYSRWAEIWPQVRAFLKDASEVAAISTNPVTNVVLQYVDLFEWRDRSKSVRVNQLLDPDNPDLPSTAGQHGELWHVHQGWFRKENLPVPGQILERIHIDGVLSQAKMLPTVKIDIYLRLDLESPIKTSDLFKGNADTLFSYLHDTHKSILAKFLTKAAAERIGLKNAST
ncbi:TIGR04255 family protein [Mesorhizobium sp. M0938]|uniref:TIGR04255 family protein n=1 Tax=unclassified Mesorhizobium TaxID=325217 RepID=UPI00333684F8